jgi:hypothetical protein
MGQDAFGQITTVATVATWDRRSLIDVSPILPEKTTGKSIIETIGWA